MASENYLFGPFIGETIYELNYFVGHAIYLRKLNPRNKIIVLTRRENFDLYGKYATTLIPFPIPEEYEYGYKPYGFNCKGVRDVVFDQLVQKFENKFKGKLKISEHFYPRITSYLKDVKWYYSREEVDFDFKPRPKNGEIASEIANVYENMIISDFDKEFKKWNDYRIFPSSYFFEKLDLSNVDNASHLGVLIEIIRQSKYVYADIDSISGRLAMLISKPLITKRDFIDAHHLHPINPYGSIVIGCQTLEEGVKYLEGFHENNI